MNGRLIVFQLPSGLPSAQRSKFHQAFWGQTTTSWGGKYSFHRKGLMDDIPYRRFSRGVLVLEPDHADQVTAFLKEWNAEVHVRRLELDETDKAYLTGQD